MGAVLTIEEQKKRIGMIHSFLNLDTSAEFPIGYNPERALTT
jgi:hypothetical protein